MTTRLPLTQVGERWVPLGVPQGGVLGQRSNQELEGVLVNLRADK